MRYVFVCLYVCIRGLHRDSDRIQHQLLLAMPPTPLPLTPPPHSTPLLWHLPCPYWLDNTQPLYATCPSARLHLREPLSPSSVLLLSAFVWILVKPPPPPPSFLVSFSLSLRLACCCTLCCPLQTQTHKKDIYRPVIASVSYFLHLPPGTKDSTASTHLEACLSPAPARTPATGGYRGCCVV